MTIDELNRIPGLSAEVAQLNADLDAIPRPVSGPAWAAAVNAAWDELRAVLQDRRDRSARQLDRLRAFIDGIQDTDTRDVFRLRFTDGRTWPEIGAALQGRRGLDTTETGLRRLVSEYMEKVNDHE